MKYSSGNEKLGSNVKSISQNLYISFKCPYDTSNHFNILLVTLTITLISMMLSFVKKGRYIDLMVRSHF